MVKVAELQKVLSKAQKEVKTCYDVYMKLWKDDNRTHFLDELREKLNKSIVESDLKGGKFKKR